LLIEENDAFSVRLRFSMLRLKIARPPSVHGPVLRTALRRADCRA
jgi:hypothetical protein